MAVRLTLPRCSSIDSQSVSYQLVGSGSNGISKVRFVLVSSGEYILLFCRQGALVHFSEEEAGNGTSE